MLEAELRKQKIEAEVVNASVGGERTDQALKRLDQAALALKPRIVLVITPATGNRRAKGVLPHF